MCSWKLGKSEQDWNKNEYRQSNDSNETPAKTVTMAEIKMEMSTCSKNFKSKMYVRVDASCGTVTFIRMLVQQLLLAIARTHTEFLLAPHT